MEKYSILKSMHNDHVALEKIINQAVTARETNKRSCQKYFVQFSQAINSHIFFEEKAIYAISKNLEPDLQALIRQVFLEHEKIKIEMEKMHEEIKNEKHIFLSDFLSLLRSHHQLEDRHLYPRMDIKLDDIEKNTFKREFEKIRSPKK